MNNRRLRPLLLAAVLLPVPAQADRHKMECFGGVSPEKEQSLAARVSCSGAVHDWEYAPLIGWIPGLQEATPTADRADRGLRKAKKASIFLVVEGAEYIAGRDSGETLDGWMIGARALFLGKKPVEPFVHALRGEIRPARSEAIAEDVITRSTSAWVLGGGADLEVNPSLHTGIVPVLRVQLDGVFPKTGGRYGRVTFGLSFRFEGSGQ